MSNPTAARLPILAALLLLLWPAPGLRGPGGPSRPPSLGWAAGADPAGGSVRCRAPDAGCDPHRPRGRSHGSSRSRSGNTRARPGLRPPGRPDGLREVEAPADAAFRNARHLDPKEFRWPYYAGYLAMKSGNADQALEALERRPGHRPGLPAPVPAPRQGPTGSQRTARGPGRPGAGRRCARGSRAAAHYYLGQIAIQGRRYQDAVTHLEAALAADPLATQCPLAPGPGLSGTGPERLGTTAHGPGRPARPRGRPPAG